MLRGAWGAVPLRRNQLAEWDAYFEVQHRTRLLCLIFFELIADSAMPEPAGRGRSEAERFDVGRPLRSVFS